MRIALCFFLLLLSITHYSQDTSKKSELQSELDRMKLQRDSSITRIDSMMNASIQELNKRELKRSLEQNERNLNAFVAEQRDREKNESRNLWIRGGIMLLVFLALIFRFVKRKKASANNS